jgi:hypothetical protein
VLLWWGRQGKKWIGEIRELWKTLSKVDHDWEHRHRKFPLTLEEVGLILWALGFGNDSYRYVESG